MNPFDAQDHYAEARQLLADEQTLREHSPHLLTEQHRLRDLAQTHATLAVCHALYAVTGPQVRA